jgi:hypothetical protein
MYISSSSVAWWESPQLTINIPFSKYRSAVTFQLRHCMNKGHLLAYSAVAIYGRRTKGDFPTSYITWK